MDTTIFINVLLVLMLVVLVTLSLALLCLVLVDLLPLLPKRKSEKIIKRAGGRYTVDYLNQKHTQHIYTNIITGSQSDAEKICDTLKGCSITIKSDRCRSI